jgi:hypothetical protein
VPDGPTVPIVAPSAIASSLETAIEPRWVRLTSRASAVSIVTVFPFDPIEPAYVIVPAAGASTGMPVADAPMSMPRCCPPAYGWSGS